MTNIPDLDLKLIYVFEALLKLRNVSRAAEELNLSQPALSQALGKLRRLFGDPLFVRTAEGMAPTPRALSLAAPLQEMATIYRERVQQQHRFDPRDSEQVFTLAASDIGELVFIPRLLRALEDGARGVRLHARRPDGRSLLESLQTGEVDVAIGAYPTLEAGIRARRLYTEHYVCLVRQGHPVIRGALSKECFLQATHIVVEADHTGHIHHRVERTLKQILEPGRIRASSRSFLLSAHLLPQTDSVLTAPHQVAAKLARLLDLQVLAPPFLFAPFDVSVLWHERFHNDPAHQWFRSLICETFGEDGQAPGAENSPGSTALAAADGA